MGKSVQSWMNALFGEGATPSWEDLEEAMKDRYLVQDHEIRLETKFEQLRQKPGETLTKFVEDFQVMLAAMKLAKVERSEARQILQFIKGLTYEDDRRFILGRDPKTLSELYQNVTRLRQAKAFGSTAGSGREGGFLRERDGIKKKKKFRLLEGTDKQRAYESGACIGCGKKGHYLRECPTEKKKKSAKFIQSKTPVKRKGAKKLKKLGKDKEAEEDEEEESSEEEKEEESSSESESEDSGNEEGQSQE